MYGHHSLVTEPDENVSIWRYMSLPKFMSLIYEQALFFSSIETLKRYEPYEASFTSRELEFFTETQELYLQSKLTVDFLEQERTSKKAFNLTMFVNCWHQNDDENAAMWKLYVPEGEGIAIKTTFRRLTQSFRPILLPDENGEATIPLILAGKVLYIDHRNSSNELELNIFNSVMRKSKYYEYEREIRAVTWLHEWLPFTIMSGDEPEFYASIRKNGGLGIPVDLETLIEKIVFISKPGQTWFANIVMKMINDMKNAGHLKHHVHIEESKLHYPLDLSF